MNFDTISELLNSIKTKNLPNWKSHKKMAPAMRLQYTDAMIEDKNPRQASVLVLLYLNKKNELTILLTKRASYNGTHSGQISFPGGKKDKNDTSLLQTALRETQEETCVAVENIQFVKELSKTYIPPSNFWVHPFLAFTKKTPIFTPNYEVEKIIEFPVKELLNEKNRIIKPITSSYMKDANVPCFIYKNNVIWGATAMILSELKDLLKQI